MCFFGIERLWDRVGQKSLSTTCNNTLISSCLIWERGKKTKTPKEISLEKKISSFFLKATPHKMRWRGLRWQKSPPDSPAPHLKFFLLYKDHKENRMKRKFWESKHLSKHQGWSSLGAYLGLHSTYATWLLTSAPKHTGTGASSGYLLAENQLQNWDPRLSPCHPPWLVGDSEHPFGIIEHPLSPMMLLQWSLSTPHQSKEPSLQV